MAFIRLRSRLAGGRKPKPLCGVSREPDPLDRQDEHWGERIIGQPSKELRAVPFTAEEERHLAGECYRSARRPRQESCSGSCEIEGAQPWVARQLGSGARRSSNRFRVPIPACLGESSCGSEDAQAAIADFDLQAQVCAEAIHVASEGSDPCPVHVAPLEPGDGSLTDSGGFGQVTGGEVLRFAELTEAVSALFRPGSELDLLDSGAVYRPLLEYRELGVEGTRWTPSRVGLHFAEVPCHTPTLQALQCPDHGAGKRD